MNTILTECAENNSERITKKNNNKRVLLFEKGKFNQEME